MQLFWIIIVVAKGQAKKPNCFLALFIKMTDADMLHHADRNHSVELAGELAIVQRAKRDAIGDAGGLGMIPCCPDLLGRNIDRGDMGACFARQMNGEAAPAGANLGDRHAGLYLQLAGGVNQLVALCLFERFMLRISKISAGILHLIVEKQAVKLGRDVVVVARMSGGKPDRIGLMPAAQAAPHPPHQLL